MKQILYIGHNIFLDRQQRYNLYNGKKVRIVGNNISCWSQKKFNCQECFSIYKLIPKKRTNCKIRENKKEYEIYLENQNMHSIFDFFSTNKEDKSLVNVKNIIDIKDGGKEWLFFKEEINKKEYNIIHTIEIKKIESLIESI